MSRYLRAAVIVAACLLPAGQRAHATAPTRLAAIVVTFPGLSAPPDGTMDWMRSVMAQAGAFYAEQSYGQFALSSDVLGVYTVPLDATANRTAVATAARQAAADAGVDLSPYAKFLYVSPATNSVRGGYGDLTGAWIAVESDYVAVPSLRTVVHELGHHVLGFLQHAHGLLCTDATPFGSTPGATCAVYDYGDSVDVMGGGWGHANGLLKRQFGWLTDGGAWQARTVTASGDYALAPYAAAEPGVKTLLAKSKQGFTYALEYRQAVGFDASIPYGGVSQPNVFGGVLLHLALNGSELLRMNPGAASPSFIDTPALLVGQSFCDRDGRLAFTVLSASPSGASVRVRFGHCVP